MLSAVFPSTENLIENGSFEADNLEEANKVRHGRNGLWKYYKSITAWERDAGKRLELQRNNEGEHLGAADGAQHIELDSNRSSAISQTILTVPGETYVLKFAHKARHGTNAADNILGIQIADGGNLLLLNETIDEAPSDWTYYTYTFTAVDSQTKLILADLGISNRRGTFVDDVSVQALVDLDVDSNNDGTIDPDNYGTDDPIEEEAPGKILLQGNALEEVQIQVGETAFAMSQQGQFRLSTTPDSTELLRIWDSEDRTTELEIDENGLISTWYDGDSIPSSIWVEALGTGDVDLELSFNAWDPDLLAYVAVGNADVVKLSLAKVSISDVIKDEGNQQNGATETDFTFTVDIGKKFNTAQTIKYYVHMGDGKGFGAETADFNFTAANPQMGTLTIPANTQTATVTVKVKQDTTRENDEEFYVILGERRADESPKSFNNPVGRGIIRSDDLPTDASWNDWKEDDHGTDPTKTTIAGHWLKGHDGNGNITYRTPSGYPWRYSPHNSGMYSMNSEGRYLKTKTNTHTAFTMTIEWRALDEKAVSPWKQADAVKNKSPKPEDHQHYSNSGVYIFDRYEVQVIDPSTFTPKITMGDMVVDEKKDNGAVVTPKSRLLPGNLYGLDPVANQLAIDFKNCAKDRGNGWNKMEIEFHPIKTDNNNDKQAATITVKLNGHTVVTGNIVDTAGKILRGTGSRGTDALKYPELRTGSIFLQSHWGSQVEYRKPEITVSDN